MYEVDLNNGNYKNIKFEDIELQRYLSKMSINSSLFNILDRVVIIESSVELYKFYSSEPKILYKYTDKINKRTIVILVILKNNYYIAVIYKKSLLKI